MSTSLVVANHTIAELRAERDDLRVANAALCADRDDLRAKLDASERAAAEMRAVLNMLLYSDYETANTWPTRHVRDAALRSDAGRDYVHRSEVEKAWRKGMTDAAAWVKCGEDVCKNSHESYILQVITDRILFVRDAKTTPPQPP